MPFFAVPLRGSSGQNYAIAMQLPSLQGCAVALQLPAGRGGAIANQRGPMPWRCSAGLCGSVLC